MEQFYQMLSTYNRKIEYSIKWPNIYKEKDPPIYWKVLWQIMQGFRKDLSCFEIGSGAGDILSLLFNLGYSDVYGIERDFELSEIANKKIEDLFGRKERCIRGEFPQKKIENCDILLMINCVYWEGIENKKKYKEKIKDFYALCGSPKIFLLEVIDDVFPQSDIYPEFVRLNEIDIKEMFSGYEISKYDTYRVALKHSSSKTLYTIIRGE